jgi:hypothetical protein
MNFITSEELHAALPQVLAAPKDQAIITSLCFRPGYNLRQFPEELWLTVQHLGCDVRMGRRIPVFRCQFYRSA